LCWFLDVGSGGRPKFPNVPTAVHTDLPVADWRQRRERLQKTMNLIYADAHHLPFRSGVFSLIHANHVLEHLRQPLQALKEWRRVCKDRAQIEIYVPTPLITNHYQANRLLQHCYDYQHYYTWNEICLRNLLQEVFNYVQVKTVVRRFTFPKSYIIHFLLQVIGIPSELQAIARTGE